MVLAAQAPIAARPLRLGTRLEPERAGGGPGATRFHTGDRVGVAWLRQVCGQCAYCRSGRENLCDDARFTGYHADGGFAERAVVPEAFAYPIPDAFGDVEAAPLLCAGIIGYRALALAAPPAGGTLAMFGFGSSAHVTLQIALARGLRVQVFTRGESRRALARRLGAAVAAAPGQAAPLADAAIIFAPAGDLVPLALRGLAPGGTLALAGIYMTPVPALDYADLARERVIRTVTASTRADAEAFLDEAARIPVRAETTTFPLEAANEALLALAGGGLAGSGVLLTAGAPRV
jgi:propanol-preferring alcohol dehydrogenase